jgi:decaprenyl-phosphate phosphoribosyltransferase
VTRARAAIEAARPSHAWKQAPVLAGLVFGHRAGSPSAVRDVLLAVLAFTLAASAGYLVNDVVDRDADRRDPARAGRPVASGRLPVRDALLVALLLAAGAVVTAMRLPAAAALDVAAYGATTLAYTAFLRRIPGGGPGGIAAGFVLRAAGGAHAAGVQPSLWLLVLTGTLALALASSKREGANLARRRATDLFLAASGLGYLAYGFAPGTVALHGTRLLPSTALPVLLALYRYRTLLRRPPTPVRGPAERIARDPLLLALGAVWILGCALVLHHAT